MLGLVEDAEDFYSVIDDAVGEEIGETRNVKLVNTVDAFRGLPEVWVIHKRGRRMHDVLDETSSDFFACRSRVIVDDRGQIVAS